VPASGNEKERFVAYTTENGLFGDFVSGIMEDKNNNLWISTESGITKFDKKNNSFIIYKFSEKTYGDHFNENANLYCRNGNMLWGSLDGLLVFNPLSFVPDTITSPIILTNFSVFDQPVRVGEKDSPLKQAISYANKIKLSYKQNTFTIEFATLALKDPQKNKYVYMLENYDKQWSSPNYLNTAAYKNIPPGKYVFKVRGTNSDGIWSNNATEINITVTPPFWLSVYAYIIYTLLILGILFMAFKLSHKFNVLNNNIKVEKELTNFKLRFFTNISHEFRTPLTLIRGAIENLNMQNDIPDKTRKQINVLNRNSSILTRLIDQLLEFRKIQNNVLTLDLEETDIIDFSREIYNSFKEIADQKNIEYLFNSNITHYNMFIDRRKVDKILYNLLSNAFKFTSKNGLIEFVINIDANREVCFIQVKDNGIGIPKDKQHLLFSRFMQINFSSAGTGIGLSLVKEFIDVHKGKIWYESNQEQGSIFNVELSTNQEIYHGENFVASPGSEALSEQVNAVMLPPVNPEENVQLPNIEKSALSNYKILVIDDNDDIRDFLVDEFSKYVQVDSADNGMKGLLLAEEINPDLIICDVMMPEMDGFEVTRRLRDDFQTCHIPIILLTAHSSMEHQLEGIQSGADAYIMKPFSLKYLLASVFKLIEQREQLKKRFSNEYVLDGNLITSTDKDKEFYNLINKIMEDHIADYQFSVDKFAELAKLRRTLFYKKVKGITGISPNELIKVKRLKRAAELLLQGDLTVSEISYKVGFEDPFYFSKCFKAQYNCSPSKYGQPLSK
jgi:signal transduction histidine kinase/DNA-binding NarL/FixJ family response regulator